MFFRTAPRLSHFDYAGSFAYFVTIVTAQRQKVFTDPALVSAAADDLFISAAKYGFRLLAYCFMPDHLHTLVAGDEWSSLPRFAQHFKQATGYAFKQRTGRQLWQPSYYDHVLRAPESVESIARYIWENPVRAELTDDWTTYEGSGPRPLPEWL